MTIPRAPQTIVPLLERPTCQFIHQRTKLIPCGVVGFVHALNSSGNHHDLLMAKVLAQAESLAFGRTPEEVRSGGTPEWLVPRRTFEGNRTSTAILAERIVPEIAGTRDLPLKHDGSTNALIRHYRNARSSASE